MEVFSKRLKEVRLEKSLTQEALGSAVCVSKQEICLYEKCLRTPPIDVLIKLADYLEVSPSWLLGADKAIKDSRGRVTSVSDIDFLVLDAIKKDKNLYSKFVDKAYRE